MRKTRREELIHLQIHDNRGSKHFPAARAVVCVLALLSGVAGLTTARLHAQDQSARVEMEFLSDGRCEVSSVGEGFRSHAVYMPTKGARRPEWHCAMPPVSSSQTVALTVSLPVGTPRPGTSVPPLEWVQVQGRWVGTAQLTKWPGSVVVASSRRWLDPRNLVTIALTVVVMVFVAGILAYSRQSRLKKFSAR
jgi:hypothetical protein